MFIFAFVTDRPLSLGILNLEIEQKSARLGALPSPKLVILAGSNGPYSHSCVVISQMLNLPCENAGIAVGIGLDDLFARYGPTLHAGDIVYMPMEIQQYTISRRENDLSADGAILFRYDRNLLWRLPADRVAGAIFSPTLTDLLESLIEFPLLRSGYLSGNTILNKQYNPQGDRIGTNLTSAPHIILNAAPRHDPGPQAILHGYGAQLIAGFVAAQTARKVAVVGGLPTDYITATVSPATISAIETIYTKNGGLFRTLSNDSHYPVADFYDSEDHLAQPCQYLHSIAVARLLAAALFIPVQSPNKAIEDAAKSCP